MSRLYLTLIGPACRCKEPTQVAIFTKRQDNRIGVNKLAYESEIFRQVESFSLPSDHPIWSLRDSKGLALKVTQYGYTISTTEHGEFISYKLKTNMPKGIYEVKFIS